jgi:hypothetical protein
MQEKKELLVEDTHPHIAVDTSALYAALDALTTADQHPAVTEVVKVIVQQLVNINHNAVYSHGLSYNVARGIDAAGAWMTCEAGRKLGPPRNTPLWQLELPQGLSDMERQHVQIGTHATMDSDVEKEHREARDARYKVLEPFIVKYGSFAKMPNRLKVRAAVMLAEAPLLWHPDQVFFVVCLYLFEFQPHPLTHVDC